MPLVHAPTFTVEGRPPILLDTMRACGALFMKTRKSAAFVKQSLANTREVLLKELVSTDLAWAECTTNHNALQASCTNNDAYVRDLLTATILLQTMGLFHQDPAERHKAAVFHGILTTARIYSSVLQSSSLALTNSLSDDTTKQYIANGNILRTEVRARQRHRYRITLARVGLNGILQTVRRAFLPARGALNSCNS